MIRILLSIALIGAAVGAATVGMFGLPGRLSRKPPVEVYSDKFFPGMDRQPKLRPQEANHFFANGLSSQLPPAGTVARSHLRDPSWFQWPLLEAAIEGNIVADFPLCNKSFNCSYSGHDL